MEAQWSSFRVTSLFINGPTSRRGRSTPAGAQSGEREVIGSVPVSVQADIDAPSRRQCGAGALGGGVWNGEGCHAIGDALHGPCESLPVCRPWSRQVAAGVTDDIAERHLFHLHAEDAVRLTGETLPSTDASKRMWTSPPVAPGQSSRLNYPLLMFAEFVAPGCHRKRPCRQAAGAHSFYRAGAMDV